MRQASRFRLIHLRQIRLQPLRTSLAVVAVAAGVSLAVAAGLLVSSLNASIEQVLRDLGGPAELRVVGPLFTGGLDESVTERIEGLEGVEAAVPVVQAVTVSVSETGTASHILALGVDCRVEALIGAFGCDDVALAPGGSEGPVVMSVSLARELGDAGVIRTDAGRVGVSGVPTNDSLDAVNAGRIAVFELGAAQSLFGRTGRLDAIHVVPAQGEDLDQLRERLQVAAGESNLVLGRDESPRGLTSGPLAPLLVLVAVLALGLSTLLVYNIAALSLAQRRRELAVAGAMGMSPRAIARGVVGESAILGLAGGVLGGVAGIALAHPLVGSIASFLVEQQFGVGSPGVHVDIRVLALGLGAGALSSMVAAAVPARRAGRIELAAELHGRAAYDDESPRRMRWFLAVLLLCGLLGMAITFLLQRAWPLWAWSPTVGAAALLLTVVALLGAAGVAAPLLYELIQRPMRRTSSMARIAIANVVRRPRRSGVMAAAVASAVAMASVLGGLIPAIRDVVLATDDSGGRIVGSTLPLNSGFPVAARPSPDTIARLEAIPGVSRVDRRYWSLVAHDAVIAIVADEGRVPVDASLAIAGEVSNEALDRGEAILGLSAARSMGLRPGSLMRLPTPEGFASVRVAGVWTDTNRNGESATLSAERMVELLGPQSPRRLFVVPEAGVGVEELADRIVRAGVDPDLDVLVPGVYAAQMSDEVAMQVEPFWAVQRALLFVSLVGALSMLLLMGLQRRRELGVLGAVGFGPGALGRLTVLEAGASALAGAVLGAIASVGMSEALRNVAVLSVGIRPPLRFDLASALVATALAVSVVVVGAALPAWRASRLEIVEAIRDE